MMLNRCSPRLSRQFAFIRCGIIQAGSAAMAASRSASGSPKYESSRQVAFSTWSIASCERVFTGQLRASIREAAAAGATAAVAEAVEAVEAVAGVDAVEADEAAASFARVAVMAFLQEVDRNRCGRQSASMRPSRWLEQGCSRQDRGIPPTIARRLPDDDASVTGPVRERYR
jgi:hypothetical protein